MTIFLKRLVVADRIDYYGWFVCFVNAIGFGLLLASATYVDALYVNPEYGVRNYPLGYSVLISCLPVFYLTYRLGSIRRNLLRLGDERVGSIITQSIFLFLVPVLTAVSLLWNFLPEFPHFGVLSSSIMVGAFTSIGMYIHNMRLNFDFSFVTDSSISVKARIESLKLLHSTWYDALKLLITIFLAIGGAYLLYGYQMAVQFTGDSRSGWFFSRPTGYFLLFYVVVFTLGIAGEILTGLWDIQTHLRNIRVVPKSNQETPLKN